MFVADIAIWVQVAEPLIYVLLIILLVPLVRAATRGSVNEAIDHRVGPQLDKIHARIDTHMLNEERDSRQVGERLARMEVSLKVLERESERRER